MTQAISTPLPADWRDFFALTKPRVMTLVIFTGLCGLLAAPGSIHPVLGFTAILCIAMGAGGSAVLNQWWEAHLDAGMKRTANRPIPAGRMNPTNARGRRRLLCAPGIAHRWVVYGGARHQCRATHRPLAPPCPVSMLQKSSNGFRSVLSSRSRATHFAGSQYCT